VPTYLAPFLSKGKEPREFEGIKGERLRTVKLRGQLSQGLLLPLEPTCANIESFLFEGLDVSEPLGIIKWERPMNAQLAGMAKGNFPSLIPKTDQERVQNLKNEINAAMEAGLEFEVTEKLEGSSMTAYMIDGEFGVCSRNMDLKQDENNSFWQVAINDNIELKIRSLDMDNIAIQGELVGPGIQGNIYNLSKHEFYVFDVYDIKGGCYLNPKDREAIIARIGLKHVPVIWHKWKLAPVDAIIAQADASSFLNKNQAREGIVFKQINGGMTFKAISNKYLMGEKD
jgi:RNA ligase (TIGR02306 family)